jgi:hypothetical protein
MIYIMFQKAANAEICSISWNIKKLKYGHKDKYLRSAR